MLSAGNKRRYPSGNGESENRNLIQLVHFVGSFPLAIGFAAQIIVLLASIKDKDKKAILQSLILMGALALILASVLLRPKSPPNLTADWVASAGALFLLTPGVEALLKLRRYDEQKSAGEATAKKQ